MDEGKKHPASPVEAALRLFFPREHAWKTREIKRCRTKKRASKKRLESTLFICVHFHTSEVNIQYVPMKKNLNNRFTDPKEQLREDISMNGILYQFY